MTDPAKIQEERALLPCPFVQCSGEAVPVFAAAYGAYIECAQCGTQTRVVDDELDDEANMAAVVQLWNSRPTFAASGADGAADGWTDKGREWLAAGAPVGEQFAEYAKSSPKESVQVPEVGEVERLVRILRIVQDGSQNYHRDIERAADILEALATPSPQVPAASWEDAARLADDRADDWRNSAVTRRAGKDVIAEDFAALADKIRALRTPAGDREGEV